MSNSAWGTSNATLTTPPSAGTSAWGTANAELRTTTPSDWGTANATVPTLRHYEFKFATDGGWDDATFSAL